MTHADSEKKALPKDEERKTTYIFFPQWGALFSLIGGAILIPIGLLVWFLLDLSAASDRVFAVEALISGLLADQVFRRLFRRNLMAIPKIKIPFVYVWILLCLYVFIAQPFD